MDNEVEEVVIDVAILRSIDIKLERILAKLNRIERHFIMDLTTLQNEVANNTTVEESAVALIQGLAAQITAAGTDPAALQAVVDTLTANDSALAAAVTANTAAASLPGAGGVSGGTDVSAAAEAANAAAAARDGIPADSTAAQPAQDDNGGVTGGTDVSAAEDAANQPTGTNAPSGGLPGVNQ